MGWWSVDILGGDSPLDCLTKIGTAIGAGNENEWSKHPQRTKDILERTQESKLRTLVQTAADPGIAAQVLAFMHVKVGAKLPAWIAAEACDSCLSEDVSGWGEFTAARLDVLVCFATEVECYPQKQSSDPALPDAG